MDPQLDALHGPSPVQKNGLVSVPRPLLRAVGIEPTEGGHMVHWMLYPEIPGTILLIPSSLVARAQDDVLDALKRASS